MTHRCDAGGAGGGRRRDTPRVHGCGEGQCAVDARAQRALSVGGMSVGAGHAHFPRRLACCNDLRVRLRWQRGSWHAAPAADGGCTSGSGGLLEDADSGSPAYRAVLKSGPVLWQSGTADERIILCASIGFACETGEDVVQP
eukprot:6468358-Prymnesium_polylepis.1